MKLVAGVDVGGTKIAAGAVGADGTLLRRHTVATPAADGPAAVLDAVATAVRALGVPIVAAGVGSAGVIDAGSGMVLSATGALPGWAGTDLRGELGARLGVPVAVDNDVHAHAVGETWRGAAAGLHTVLLVAVGTGVGGSLVLGGRVHHGAHAVAGHVGHTPVPEAAGVPCACGGSGHAEALGSGPAMLADYRRRSGRDDAAHLAQVVRRAERGDGLAGEVLARGATAVGQAIGGLVNVLDPELVLLGGGVSGSGELWWEPMRAAVAAEVLPPLRGVPLRAGALGADAAVIGAARLAWQASDAGAGTEAAAGRVEVNG